METRRGFLRKGAAVAGAALLDGACVRPLARVPASRPVVVYMGVNFPTDDANVQAVGHFREGLREQGLVEGRDLAIEWLWAEGRGHPWAREQMVDLIRRRVDIVIVAGTLWRTVREMTSEIPIVTLAGNGENVVAFGWAADVAAPGGNITGLSYVPNQEFGKRLECLTRVAPRAHRLMLATNLTALQLTEAALRTTAAQFGFEMMLVDIRAAADVESAFVRAEDWGADSLCGEQLNPVSLVAAPVAVRARRIRMPSIYNSIAHVQAGGLMQHGAKFISDGYANSRAAWYVARILDGVPVGKLPIELPTGNVFVVNKRTLFDLGLTLPPDIALQVTQWIE